MSRIEIDTMRACHLPAVLAIEKDLFDSPWTEGMFQQEVDSHHLSRPLVTLADGRVVGYLVAWLLREEVHLLNVAVARPFQRKGLARG